LIDGSLSIAGSITLASVRGGKQDLADGAAMAGKRPGPFVGQVNLANGGGCLLGSQATRAFFQTQRAHTSGNRAGRHDNDVSVFHALNYGINDAVNLVTRDRKIFFGQRGGTNLYHDSVRRIDLCSQGSFWQQV